MKALILAAGYATRLYPLTENKAKPLLQVGNKTIIDHLIEKIKNTKIEETLVVTNGKFYEDFKEWGNADIIINDGSTNNENRLGAIRDIQHVIEHEHLDEDVLIIAGDNFFTFDLNEFLEFSKDKQCVIVARNLESLEEAKKHGNLEIDGNGKITKFIEKPLDPKSKLSAICVYYMKKEVLNMLKDYEGSSDATGFFMEWLTQKIDVHAWVNDETYFDIGDKERLEQARRYIDEHIN